MSAGDPALWSLTELADAIRARRISSLEATEACLARIERHGARLNAIAGIDPADARAQARRADEDLAAGHLRGPLHGVPLAHKDMYYRKGRPCAHGSRIRADFVPDHTATALERLDAAGALDIARLNMVEFALGVTGHNDITGTPRNPWNEAHVPGGSSSGSGVAVAARLVPAALGSDTGGSIRLPAACCGVVGLKPTYGRISRHGAMPLSFSLDTIGPLTRTVEDAALLLQVMAGHDPMDPLSADEPVPDYRAGIADGVRGLRIAVPENYLYDPVTDEIRALMDQSLEVFRSLGATIVPVTIARIEAANDLTILIIACEGASFHAKWLRERAQDYGRYTIARFLNGMLYPAVHYIEALRARRAMLEAFAEAVFERADLLHVPTLPYPVPTIEESDLAANPGFIEYIGIFGHCVRPFNLLGLPSLSLPAGLTASGLPSAFQLVGRPFDEATVLRAGRAYERETQITDQAPPLDG